MPSQLTIDQVLAELEQLFDGMLEHQRAKVLETARRKVPTLTPEDIMNPEQFPEIYEDGPFNFEDGILSGMVSAQIAMRARLKQLKD
ncbi:MAG: hypothetical protein ACK4N5_10495 [Myxococcales bacterium]